MQRLSRVAILCNRAQAVVEHKRLVCDCQIIAQVDYLRCIAGVVGGNEKHYSLMGE